MGCARNDRARRFEGKVVLRRSTTRAQRTTSLRRTTWRTHHDSSARNTVGGVRHRDNSEWRARHRCYERDD